MSKKLREEVGKYDAVINHCDKEYSTSDFKKTKKLAQSVQSVQIEF